MYPPASFKKLWLACATLSLASCGHAPPKREVASPPQPPGEEILVEEGDSSQPSYSADGKRLLFVSAKRPQHNTPQVYLKDLKSGFERRVTFQNGVVSRPRFHPKAETIVYASTTDEDKEYPAFLREEGVAKALPMWLKSPTELYLHGLDSYDIKRLSVHAGSDGDPHFIKNGHVLTWTQVTADKVNIRQSYPPALESSNVKGLGPNATEYVLADDKHTAAWISYDDKFTRPHLMLKRENIPMQVAAEHLGSKGDLAFSPDSKWLLWSEFDDETKTYKLFSLDIANNCAREVLFASEGSRRHPVLASDAPWLTYTSIGVDKSRIARTKFEPKACL